MDQIFLTELNIVNTRHLHNIKIPLSGSRRKHLILTGKNGSGKTSILECISDFLKYLVSDDFRENDSSIQIADLKDTLNSAAPNEKEALHKKIRSIEMNTRWRRSNGCVVEVNNPQELRQKYMKGDFVLSYCRDDRRLGFDICTNPVGVEMKQVYEIDEHPVTNIGKYLAHLKFVQALVRSTDRKRSKYIDKWFCRFQQALRDIYEEQELELIFDEETFCFSISIPKRPPIPLEHMSMGYAAVFDIIGDLMMRMENHHSYDLEGIVLIDEIETHLHVSLQRKIMPILTGLFPNIQFILTSHSPFILISTEDAVVYDLETGKRVEDKMTWQSYDAVVEGYFNTDCLSQKLIDLLDKYRDECTRPDRKLATIKYLEKQLDQIPSFLASEFVLKYKEMKLDYGSGSDRNYKSR